MSRSYQYFRICDYGEEINEIARRIIVDIRDKQLRYQDIAILYRDESYAYLFDSILPLYNIPL